jgi:hypothetical protein
MVEQPRRFRWASLESNGIPAEIIELGQWHVRSRRRKRLWDKSPEGRLFIRVHLCSSVVGSGLPGSGLRFQPSALFFRFLPPLVPGSLSP